jgi:hypothetical protein
MLVFFLFFHHLVHAFAAFRVGDVDERAILFCNNTLFFHVSIHFSRHRNGLSMVFIAGKTVIGWFLNGCSFVFLCLVYAFQNPVPADF